MTACKLSVCLLALSVAATSVAQARGCASASEISAIQISAVQQELTDAALACGPREVALFNRFQKTFGPELRKSDGEMLRMFKRLHGVSKGNAEYDSYKTRAIAHAEQRRTKPGAHDNFCKSADIVFAAALAPDKPVLADLVAGIEVKEASPVDACEIRVAITLEGVKAGAEAVPTPRPSQPGDPATAAGDQPAVRLLQ
ncbi:MAG: hypothetical protein H6924_09880 [Alphaproteobacteria bacterium]|nr:hypothetical protein [Alphaproteobacteria bacterium]